MTKVKCDLVLTCKHNLNGYCTFDELSISGGYCEGLEES